MIDPRDTRRDFERPRPVGCAVFFFGGLFFFWVPRRGRRVTVFVPLVWARLDADVFSCELRGSLFFPELAGVSHE